MCRRFGTLRSYGAASRFQPAIYKHCAALRLRYRSKAHASHQRRLNRS